MVFTNTKFIIIFQQVTSQQQESNNQFTLKTALFDFEFAILL